MSNVHTLPDMSQTTGPEGYQVDLGTFINLLTEWHKTKVEFLEQLKNVPEGITIETPSQTEIFVKGVDKQKVGQVSAEIRAFRPPEPYKGKGVKYSNETILRKEAKKK